MTRSRWIGVVVLMLALAGPTFAGEKGHKCSQDTQTCLNMMAQKLRNRGWVGVEMEENENTGLMTVTRVVADSPAAAAGLQVGDVMTGLNGIPFSEENKDKVYEARKNWSPGTQVTYTIDRQGVSKEIRLTLGELPEEVLAQWIGHHMLTDHAVVEVAKQD